MSDIRVTGTSLESLASSLDYDHDYDYDYDHDYKYELRARGVLNSYLLSPISSLFTSDFRRSLSVTAD